MVIRQAAIVQQVFRFSMLVSAEFIPLCGTQPDRKDFDKLNLIRRASRSSASQVVQGAIEATKVLKMIYFSCYHLTRLCIRNLLLPF